MAIMEKEEIEQLFKENPHLQKYVGNIKEKISEPVFYKILSFEVGDESNPNLIYSAQGPVFVHVYRTTGMDELEYHAIEPAMDEVEKEKHDRLLKLILKKAPEKKSVIEDNELKKVIEALIDEIIVIDEKAGGVNSTKKGVLRKFDKNEKIKTTSIQRKNIEYSVIKNITQYNFQEISFKCHNTLFHEH